MGEFKPTFPQFRDQGNGYLFDFLKKEESVVVLFFCPQYIDGQEPWDLIGLIERLAERYRQNVKFFWLDSLEEHTVAKKMAVNCRPVIVLFHKNREIGRFSCPSSEPGIFQEIDFSLQVRHNQGLNYIRNAILAT